MTEKTPENSEILILERSEEEIALKRASDSVVATMPIVPKTLVAEFLERCVYRPETGCWLWKGKVSHNRAPMFCFHGRTVSALRTSWELFVGSPPVGGQFRRVCNEKLCVCPKHLKHNSYDLTNKASRASPFRKLSEEAVIDIRSGQGSKSFYARKYNVTEWTIWAVRRGLRGKIAPIAPTTSKNEQAKLEKKNFVAQTVELLKDLNSGRVLD